MYKGEVFEMANFALDKLKSDSTESWQQGLD